MAWIKSRNGFFEIRFKLKDKQTPGEWKPKTITLPKGTKSKEADKIKAKVEELISTYNTGTMNDSLKLWLDNECGQVLYEKLCTAELVPKKDKVRTLGDLRDFVLKTKEHLSGNTQYNWQNWFDNLFEFKPETFPIDEFTGEVAIEFSVFCTKKFKAGNSCNKNVSNARSAFKEAVIAGWIQSNPFMAIKAPTKQPKSKPVAQVTDEDFERLTRIYNKTTDQKKWLAIFALLRFGALRGGSELRYLNWSLDCFKIGDCDSPCTITVTSPKKVNCEDENRGVERTIPLPPIAEKLLLDWKEASKAEDNPKYPYCPMFPDIKTKMDALAEKQEKQIKEGKKITARVEFNVDTIAKKAFKKIGIVLGRGYDLRKNGVSDWLRPDKSGYIIDPVYYEHLASHKFEEGMKDYQQLFPDRYEEGKIRLASRWANDTQEVTPPVTPEIP